MKRKGFDGLTADEIQPMDVDLYHRLLEKGMYLNKAYREAEQKAKMIKFKKERNKKQRKRNTNTKPKGGYLYLNNEGDRKGCPTIFL